MTDWRRRRSVVQAGLSMPARRLERGVGDRAPGRTPDGAGRRAAQHLATAAAPRRATRHRQRQRTDSGRCRTRPTTPGRMARGADERGFGTSARRARMLTIGYVSPAKAIGFLFAGHGCSSPGATTGATSAIATTTSGVLDVNAVIKASAAQPMNVVILALPREPFGGAARALAARRAPNCSPTPPPELASDGEANGSTPSTVRGWCPGEDRGVFKRVRLRRGAQRPADPWESTSLEEDFWFSAGGR